MKVLALFSDVEMHNLPRKYLFICTIYARQYM